MVVVGRIQIDPVPSVGLLLEDHNFAFDALERNVAHICPYIYACEKG